MHMQHCLSLLGDQRSTKKRRPSKEARPRHYSMAPSKGCLSANRRSTQSVSAAMVALVPAPALAWRAQLWPLVCLLAVLAGEAGDDLVFLRAEVGGIDQ